MTRTRRPSEQTRAVLLALADAPTAWRYGYELCQQLDLKAGAMYPILMRLADRGLLETAWETDPPTGRPPRHLYRLTGAGLTFAGELATATRQLSVSQSLTADAAGVVTGRVTLPPC